MAPTNVLCTLLILLSLISGGYSTAKCIPNCLECPEDNLSICNPDKCAMGYAEANNHTACLSCAENCLRCLDAGPGKCDENYCREFYTYDKSSQNCTTTRHCYEENCLDCTHSNLVCHKCKEGFTYQPRWEDLFKLNPGCRACAENCQKCDENFVGKCDSDGCNDGFEYDSFTGACKVSPCTNLNLENCLKCVNNVACDECRPPLKPNQQGKCEIDPSSCVLMSLNENTVPNQYGSAIRSRSGDRSFSTKLICTNSSTCHLSVDLNTAVCIDSATYLLAFEVYLENVSNFTAKLDNLIIFDKKSIDRSSKNVNKTYTEQKRGRNWEMEVEFNSKDRKFKYEIDICCERNCDEGCEDCTFGSCKKCSKGYVLKNDQCHACGQNCVECDKNAPSKCLECKIGHAIDAAGVCKPCAPHCLKCKIPYTCDEDQCRLGYAFEEAKKTCGPCAPHCMQCFTSGPGKCEEAMCKRNFYYDGAAKVCLGRKCLNKELAHCLNCEENPKVCRVCKDPYIPNPVTGECYLTSALCSSHLDLSQKMRCNGKDTCLLEKILDCNDSIPFFRDMKIFYDDVPYKTPYGISLDEQLLNYKPLKQSNITIGKEQKKLDLYQINKRGAEIAVQFNNTGDSQVTIRMASATCCIKPKEYQECKTTTAGKEYKGTAHKTRTGKPCQHWSASEPHQHNMTTSQGAQFPDGTDTDAKNYCRNPTDDRPDGPWCYIAQEGSDPTWDYCDVNFCECGKYCKKCSHGSCKMCKKGYKPKKNHCVKIEESEPKKKKSTVESKPKNRNLTAKSKEENKNVTAKSKQEKKNVTAKNRPKKSPTTLPKQTTPPTPATQ